LQRPEEKGEPDEQRQRPPGLDRPDQRRRRGGEREGGDEERPGGAEPVDHPALHDGARGHPEQPARVHQTRGGERPRRL
jgi:hypothetical protein